MEKYSNPYKDKDENEVEGLQDVFLVVSKIIIAMILIGAMCLGMLILISK